MTTFTQEITNAGGTFAYDPQAIGGDGILYLYTSGAIVLAANVTINISNLPNNGNKFIIVSGLGVNSIDLNGFTVTINGQVTPQWVCDNQFYWVIETFDTGISSQNLFFDLFLGSNNQGLDGTAVLLDGSVSLAKLVNLTSAQIIVGSAGNIPTAVAMSGDAIISNVGAVTIANLAITNAKVSASAAIAFSKLAALSSGNILVGSGANVATSVTMSGDATIDNTGALTIANDAITNAKIADDAVTLTNLASTGQVYSNATTVATAANTTETTLASFAMGSAIGDADGDVLEVYAYGSFGATANNKSVRLRFGATLGTATQLCINTTTAAPNGINWVVKAKLFRTGAAAQKGQAEILFSGIASELDNFTATETWSTSTIFLSGQNGTAAANDIVLEGFEVKIGRTNNN